MTTNTIVSIMEKNNRKPIVGITQGDGNGIGYEVIIKSLADARILESFTPVIYGSSKIFGFYRKLIHNLDQMDTYVIQSAKDAYCGGIAGVLSVKLDACTVRGQGDGGCRGWRGGGWGDASR